MRRNRYSVSVWTDLRADGTRCLVTTVEASDAKAAVRGARRQYPDAIAVEIRSFPAGATVLESWGDRSRSPVCNQCGAVAERATS